MVEHFNNRHLAARSLIIRRHFQPDHAAADDGQFRRDFRKRQHFAVREHPAGFVSFAQAGNRRHDGRRARRNEQVLRFIGLPRRFHGEAARNKTFDYGPFFHNGHFIRLQAGAHAAHQRFDNLRAPLFDERMIKPDISGDYAESFAMLCMVVNLCGIEQRLGRNAAFVQAHAAHLAHFKTYDVQPRMTRALRGEVTGRASAEYDQIMHDSFRLPTAAGCSPGYASGRA